MNFISLNRLKDQFHLEIYLNVQNFLLEITYL